MDTSLTHSLKVVSDTMGLIVWETACSNNLQSNIQYFTHPSSSNEYIQAISLAALFTIGKAKERPLIGSFVTTLLRVMKA